MAESRLSVFKVLQGTKQKTSAKADKYLHYFDKKSSEGKDQKEKIVGNSASNVHSEDGKKMVNNFYDLATDFYEYGWGESFHFAPMEKGESLKEAITKHELYLAMKLALRPGDHVLDLGCGVGGPARTIANFSKANITGINNNDYQIGRAKLLTEKAGLSHLCTFKKGDFTKLENASDSVDKVFTCEALCHAPFKVEAFAEIFRVLKPGGLVASYDWLLTDKFDPDNSEHKKVVEDINEGNALPLIQTVPECLQDMKSVGFEIVEEQDLALNSAVPWQTPLEPGLLNVKATPVGRMATHSMLYCMEKLGLSPKGSTRVHNTLCLGADGLIKGGNLGIFTAMYFTLARKPETTPK